jgi:hypothetical protein
MLGTLLFALGAVLMIIDIIVLVMSESLTHEADLGLFPVCMGGVVAFLGKLFC